MSNLLVELGTEELPVDILDVVYNDLKSKTEDALRKSRLTYKEVLVEATPRRIALFVSELSGRQTDENLEISGPSFEKAYAADGKPTPALEGFLKSKGASLKDVQLKESPKGKFVVVQMKNIGKPTAAVIPQILQDIFASLTFPKNMRWEKTGFRFPRPARWLVALLDKRVLNFQFAGLRASNKSFGHRFLSPKSFQVLSADWELYRKTLRKAHVILDLKARKEMIAQGLERDFSQKNYDEELVHITSQLAEEPYLLQGSFSKDYLQLPKEVLASCMKKNQKIFACYDGSGRLSGKFIAILNGKRQGLPEIRMGYENVLESRLKDARYFYKADTKEPLEKKAPLLEQVTYLGKLGNMLQKTERLEKLSEKLAHLAGKSAMKDDLKRVAKLSKIDLMTHLVYEFPDLQGIIGREYAAFSGDKKEVALAIGTQYLPKNLSQDFQEVRKDFNELGALFAVADRLDLLVGAFGTGIQPSGSQDPFALRRAGGSIVKLLHAFPFSFSLREAVEASASLYGNALTVPKNELTDKLMKFFEERLAFELQVKPGTREHEILQAVSRASFDDLANVFDRYDRLLSLYKKEPEAFIKTAKVIERTANITKGVKETGAVNPQLLAESSEKELHQVLEKGSPEIKGLLNSRDYEKATVRFGELFYKPIHDFFEQVMVNVEDANIRANRQALMRQINRLYTEKVADLSVLSRLDQG